VKKGGRREGGNQDVNSSSAIKFDSRFYDTTPGTKRAVSEKNLTVVLQFRNVRVFTVKESPN